MKKTVILFLLVLSIIMTLPVRAQFVVDNISSYDSEETVTFIVEMEGSPVLPEIKLSQENKGSIKNGNEQTYRNALLMSHKKATDAINSELSDDIKPKYTYTEIFNGFAIEAKYKDMEIIKNTEGVKNVYISQKREVDFRMSNAPSMTHSLPSETFGYTGSGQVIAVLDSEFDVKHVAFSKAPQNPKYTKQSIASILAETTFNAPTEVNRVYESTKIPFRYDYGEGDSDTYSTANLHGTHVAGIAAGNSPDGDFCGVAPDAQLVLMKISDSDGRLTDASMAAAMDDAAKLKVCAINCSFGFTYQATDTFNPVLATCYANAYNSGIFVSVAAGNEGRGFLQTSPQETIHIDDSATGNPNGLSTSVSVASVDNTISILLISEITLSDGNVIDSYPMHAGTAQAGTDYFMASEYEYCRLGTPEDFEGLDLNGKIAVIDRGTLSFAEKSDNAKAAGAIGMIIINNDDTYFSSPVLSLPAVCVKASYGGLLKNAELKRISSIAPFTEKEFENDLTISSFSSYGTTEALGLKPDISAPGGSIFSTLPGDKYGASDGTSMAAPHISGVVAIITQYLEDMGCTANSSERIELIANMMMSSADVIYMPSDDEENKVPFSPRVQGAGLVNTANAIRTPVILYADTGKTKIEFGDNLTDTLEIKFTAQNLTGNDVVYDKISAVTLTDGYESKDGKNYISDARLLKSELITDFDTVIVPANSSVTVSAQLKLDSDELYENSLIFTNGFHIDGFIRLESTTTDTISVGMPFMGFYGNWTQAPVFDTTIYDEGGSHFVDKAKGIKGTYLYSNLGDKTIILGYNGISNIHSTDAIAISPDGNGSSDILGVQFIPMRSIKDLKLIISSEYGEILETHDIGIVNKFVPLSGAFNISEDIVDGTYFITLEGYMNYNSENSIKHSLSIPFKVDRQASLVKGCRIDGNILTVDIYDTSGVYFASLTDSVTGNRYQIYYDSYVTDTNIAYIFDDDKVPDLSNITLEIIDNAMNFSSYSLGDFDGKIDAYISGISTDEESYSITFGFTGNNEFSDASLILAFYDENGTVMHTDIMHNQSVTSGECEFTGNFDASTADKCKLFIWKDAKTFNPLDTAKVFDMNMYKINSGIQ